MEYLIDENTKAFVGAVESKGGQPIDLSEWLQWYAFDVIGSITFRQTFGFLDSQNDPQHIIEGLDVGFKYSSIIGMMPKLHRVLLGSQRGTQMLSLVPSLARANQGPVIGKVRFRTSSHRPLADCSYR